MSNHETIFSVRLVVSDFYMEKPTFGLDPCYSEFRGREIKKVPIIRIFGSNTSGQKTCMHVHGVFPYFYIPYEQKDFESLNQAFYQIAINLDKAINISLGQASSTAQHVFKIQLVKGIPFYGYHRREHQFLKIYLFNPRFVRRAANLLQNGAILGGKIFHPHESHVPYILQFMIDFNLYGMSLLHVPLEIVKFRHSDGAEGIQPEQILSETLAKKQSNSALEVDIGANFILNRFLLISQSNSTHKNPGIESIWHDEQIRRQKLVTSLEDDDEKLQLIPPLEIPATQERPEAQPAESELFYRTALLSRLLAMETSISGSGEAADQTINCTLLSNSTTTSLNNTNAISNKEKKRTFNLKKLLVNAVYPEECTQHDLLTNASFVENHLSNTSSLQTTLNKNREADSYSNYDSMFLDETVVDEELVLTLTQQHVPLNATLREQDFELLDVLEQLEEVDANKDHIDFDSSLAQLSQHHKNLDHSPKLHDQEAAAALGAAQPSSDKESDSDNEDENICDFTMVMEDVDVLLTKLTQSQTAASTETDFVPQIDGSDDLLCTPKKAVHIKKSAATCTKQQPTSPRTPNKANYKRRLSLASSPSRSPRTPKTSAASKYAPLPLIVKNQSEKKKVLVDSHEQITPRKSGLNLQNKAASACILKNAACSNQVHKKDALREVRRNIIPINEEIHATNAEVSRPNSRITARRSGRLKDLDKTHITCALTPRRTSEKKLKVYTAENDELNLKNKKLLKTQKSSEFITEVFKSIAQENHSTTTKRNNKDLSDDSATLPSKPHANDETATYIQKVKNTATKSTDDDDFNKICNVEKTPEAKPAVSVPFKKFNEPQKNVSKTKLHESVIMSPIDKNELSDKEEIIESENEHNESIKLNRIRVKLKRLSRNFLDASKTKESPIVCRAAQTKLVNTSELKSIASTHTESLTTKTKDSRLHDTFNSPQERLFDNDLPARSVADKEVIESENELNESFKLNRMRVKLKRLSRSFLAASKTKASALATQKNLLNSPELESIASSHTKCLTPTKTSESIDIFNSPQKTVSDNDPPARSVANKEAVIESENELNESIKLKRIRVKLKRLSRSFLAASKAKTLPLVRSATQKNLVCTPELKSIASAHTKCLTPTTTPTSRLNDTFNSPQETAFDNDLTAHSFYDKSFIFNSPSVFSDASPNSPMMLTKHNNLSSPLTETPNDCSVILTPLDLAPTYEEVLASCRKFDIPEYEFQQPFYNNPADVTQRKEIGLTVLTIPCNKLNDCPEFQSILGADLKGLNDWCKKQLQNIGGPAMLNRFRSTQQIREYFATKKSICIAPQMIAPSRHDAKLWLKARELVSNKKDEDVKKSTDYYADDSPIKIQRKKVTMMLNEDAGTNSGDEDRDCSGRSFTLTPLTPASVTSKKADEQSDKDELASNQNDILTPLTTRIKLNTASGKKSRTHSKRSRLSLTSKFKKAAAEAKVEIMTSLTETPKIKCITEGQLLKSGSWTTNSNQEQTKSSQSSERSSISSQEVLNDLGRASFVNNLNLTSSGQHDVSFGLSNATLNNTFGFKVNLENLQQAKANIEFNYLTTITLEVFVPTRGDFYPDPFRDEIRCIFYAIDNSIPTQETAENVEKKLPRNACGYIIVNDFQDIMQQEGKRHGIDADINVQIVNSELESLHALLELCSIWDPDIYAGYEIEMSSWGYIIERAKHLNFNITSLLSRVPTQKVRDFVDEDRDQFTDLDVEMKLCGRILLDVWRLMRSEIALTSYTFENVMYHIMHRRCPCHSYADLTAWFQSPASRWITIEYYLERVHGTLALLDQLDLIGRTCEMAKLIGIQFYEVLSRGSQFRVESMMLRIAKPRNLVPLSPSVQQRAHMRAPEYLALILEPLSRFYVDPVIVLDFQSLYPSMIIAYNYCFSTCLGRVEHLGQTAPFEFGASQLKVSPSMLRHLLDEDLVTISPCGVVFVKSSVREGILPRMLNEILDTRQMVKQSMKLHKNNTALQRILHSRQLGLKLMANVTYGYTAANFSGRMPSVEVGDTVVSKGRETLERAIKMVEANDRWDVKVVYGDTDSMFIQVPGRSRAKAFEIGAEIAEAITKANPHPVKLKLEKVYQPCILQTKKRYVGYMYETPDQTEPVYEAKGIETVRRDGCPAAVKMLEKVLRILFETKDVSQVKQYVCRQFTKLLSGRANLQDLIFAKEFRGLNGYRPTACVPALELTRKWIQTDPRRIPRRGERVPFIITNGPPGVPLIRLVRSPHEVLADEGLKINAIYYITKAIIPPLNRCLLLIGADVNDWFANLPRKILTTPALSNANEVISTTLNAIQVKKSTISQYFSTTNCIIDCGRHTKNGICSACDQNATKSITILHSKISKIERGFFSTQQICQACCGRIGDIKCISLDCPVLFVLAVKRKDLQQIVHFRNLLEDRF